MENVGQRRENKKHRKEQEQKTEQQPRPRKELLEMLSKVVDLLSEEERNELSRKLTVDKGDLIPLSVFQEQRTALEAIVLYLKENKKKSIKEIAVLLNRKKTTIYTTHQRAREKKSNILIAYPKLFAQITENLFLEPKLTSQPIHVPLSIFSNRKFSILESLISFLKEKHHLTLIHIAELLKKNYSTIKTIHWRYKKKCH